MIVARVLRRLQVILSAGRYADGDSDNLDGRDWNLDAGKIEANLASIGLERVSCPIGLSLGFVENEIPIGRSEVWIENDSALDCGEMDEGNGFEVSCH